MTISLTVQRQFYRFPSSATEELIRIPPTVIMCHNLPRHARQAPIIKTKRRLNIWTVEEHERFLVGLEQFPKGPWKVIASIVGTKTTRQTMTHAQKYREKIKRTTARAAVSTVVKPSGRSDTCASDELQPIDCCVGSSDVCPWDDVIGDWSTVIDSEIDYLLRELELLPLDEIVAL